MSKIRLQEDLADLLETDIPSSIQIMIDHENRNVRDAGKELNKAYQDYLRNWKAYDRLNKWREVESTIYQLQQWLRRINSVAG